MRAVEPAKQWWVRRVASSLAASDAAHVLLGRVFRGAGRFRFSVVVLAGCVLLLVGCQTGTITGEQQTCRSAGGFLERQEISCSGSVGGVSGSPSLGIVEADDDLDGAYRLDATITVERGEARAFVTDAGGEQVGGELVPDEPLRITATVEPDEDVEFALEVPEGERVENLSYEATLVPQE